MIRDNWDRYSEHFQPYCSDCDITFESVKAYYTHKHTKHDITIIRKK